MTTPSNETSDPTPHLADSTPSFAEFKDIDHRILKKIVNGRSWTQIKGKQRDHKVLVPLVNNMKAGTTLADVEQHPDFQIMVNKLQTSPLQDLTRNKTQGVDVLAAFVQTYTKEKDIQLAQRVRNWATYIARQLVLNETHPFADSPEQKLVEVTQSDPVFWKFYNFKSWTEGWKHPIRGDPSTSPVKLVSIDSEKVKVEKDGRKFYCLARLCAVGSDYKPLIDEFIVPAGTVIDYCTEIHGITEENLRGATVTQADVQAMVMDLVTPGTILVGHSLNNDLTALRIDYKRVIDTAMLFVDHRKEAGELCGLRDLCEEVLGYSFREKGEPHDCLKDAIVPMKLVHHRLILGQWARMTDLLLRACAPPP